MTATLALGAPRVARRLARVMPRRMADGIVLGGGVVVGYAAIGAAERVRPFRPEWNEPHGDVVADAAHMATSAGVGVVAQALALAVAAPAKKALGRGPHGDGRWPARAPLVLRLALSLVLAELGHYWVHRVSHESARLWPLHAVHHSAPRLHWFNATRFHPLDIASQIFFQVLPLYALGIDDDAMLSYGVFSGIYGPLQHSNVGGNSGLLGRVFSTPEQHRRHHSTDLGEGSSNYGAVLAVWDDVFGTALRPRRDFDADVGVAGEPDFPRTWAAHMASPFRAGGEVSAGEGGLAGGRAEADR